MFPERWISIHDTDAARHIITAETEDLKYLSGDGALSDVCCFWPFGGAISSFALFFSRRYLEPQWTEGLGWPLS